MAKAMPAYFQGRFDEALRHAQGAKRNDPSNLDAYKLLGQIYEKKKNPRKAVQNYREYIKRGGKTGVPAFKRYIAQNSK